MLGIVVYRSKTGYTKRYAELISDQLSFKCKSITDLTESELSQYDIILYGGSLHASGINGLTKLKQLLKSDDESKLKLVFAVGATPYTEGVETELSQANQGTFPASELSKGQSKGIPLFYLRGGFNFKKLNLGDKILMQLLKMKIKIKSEANRTADERGMLAAYSRVIDFVRADKTLPIVRYISALQNENSNE